MCPTKMPATKINPPPVLFPSILGPPSRLILSFFIFCCARRCIPASRNPFLPPSDLVSTCIYLAPFGVVPLSRSCFFLYWHHFLPFHQGGVGRECLRGHLAPAPVPQGRRVRGHPDDPPKASGVRPAGRHSRGHQQQPSRGYLRRDRLRENDSG